MKYWKLLCLILSLALCLAACGETPAPTTEATEPVAVEKEAAGIPAEGVVVFLVCLVVSFLGGAFLPRIFSKRKENK